MKCIYRIQGGACESECCAWQVRVVRVSVVSSHLKEVKLVAFDVRCCDLDLVEGYER